MDRRAHQYAADYSYENYAGQNVDPYYAYQDSVEDAYYSSDGTRLPTSPSPAYYQPAHPATYHQGDQQDDQYYQDESQYYDGYDQQAEAPQNFSNGYEDDQYAYSDPSSRDYYDPAPQQPAQFDRRPAANNEYEPRQVFQPESSTAHVPRNKHGIQLMPVSSLPDVYRSLFKFGVFNAMQSKCYDTAVHSDENMIISAPTGSGKTVLFELALIRLLMKGDTSAKCVYMAPTKALCNERYGDWTAKFQAIGINCCQLTGDTVDTGKSAWSEAKKSSIIITTPEKWDSLTRNWRDHGQILSQMRLFLVDEVHILNDTRGSTLEVCISRMRLRGSDVRFMLLSATVPNIEDVASWIGSAENSEVPASVFTFGDEFRPCPIKRIVYGYPRKANSNDFQFMSTLDYKLFTVLRDHAEKKPVIVFCATRKSCSTTADLIAKGYKELIDGKGTLPWPIPRQSDMNFHDKSLREWSKYGIGIHHAGLDPGDRRMTEELFMKKILYVIVATSTLAVGVNFPAHTVIIKGTKQWVGNGWAEYSDLDILQMMGRAGRPQFDKEGVAILMTEQSQEAKYKALMGGRTLLESSLHQNLTEHINSEIQLGTINDFETARQWLHNSFLFRRIQKNPKHYGMGKTNDQTWDGRLAAIADESINKLKENKLVEEGDGNQTLHATEYGEIMSRYYVRYSTMCAILKLSEKAGLRDILEMLSNADEFHEMRLRQGEKAVYNKMRQDPDIRFRVQKVEKVGDKVMTLIQGVLGGLALSSPEYKCADATTPALEATNVFKHAGKLAKAIVEVGIVKRSAHQIKFGMELVKSINAKAWEDRPIVLRQIPNIGDKSIKTLALSGITDLDSLRRQQPSRIELLLNRNPTFGRDVLAAVQAMPDYTLRVEEVVISSSRGQKPVSVTLHIEAAVACDVPKPKGKKGKSSSLGMTSILTTNSDMDLIDFRRIPTKSLIEEKRDFEVEILLTKPSQTVTVSISGDNFAGLTKSQTYKPALPPTEYPTLDTRPLSDVASYLEGIDVNRLWEDFEADFVDLTADNTARDAQTSKPEQSTKEAVKRQPQQRDLDNVETTKLPNGNYSCNHNCKDKTTCRHLCCREGLAKPPNTASRSQAAASKDSHSRTSKTPDANRSTVRKVDKNRRDKRLEDLETLHSASATQSIGSLRIPASKPLRGSMPMIPDLSAQGLDDDDDDLIDIDDLLASTSKASNSNPAQSRYRPENVRDAAEVELDELDGDLGLSPPPVLASRNRTVPPNRTPHAYESSRRTPSRAGKNRPLSPPPLSEPQPKRLKVSHTSTKPLESSSANHGSASTLARFKNTLSKPTQFSAQYSRGVPSGPNRTLDSIVADGAAETPLFRPESDNDISLDNDYSDPHYELGSDPSHMAPPVQDLSMATSDTSSRSHPSYRKANSAIRNSHVLNSPAPAEKNPYDDVMEDFERWLADPNNVEIIP